MKNEKTWKLLGAVLLVASALAFSGHLRIVDARLTGTNPTGANSDVACFGPKSHEVCVDYLGNWLPTTNNTQTIGTSALQYSNVFATTLTAGSGGVVNTGPVSLLSGTSVQLQARADPAGTCALEQDAGVTSSYAQCCSTAPVVGSYVFIATVTTANIGKICN